MPPVKSCFIKDIEEGRNIQDLFLIKEMSRAETRNGKPYLILTVMDRTGEIGGRIWDNADQLMEQCSIGNIVVLQAQSQSYKGVLQLKIDMVQAVAGETVDIGLFLPSSTAEVPVMAEEVVALAGSVRTPPLRKLLLQFFRAGDFFDDFKKAPAAKTMHHAYLGGLLEHTLAVSRLADRLSEFYPALDRSLLLAGALLHDVGKVKEFSFETYPFNYTDRGRLLGHLMLGAEMVRAKVDRIKDFPEDLAVRLQHLILSHHGRHEYGSPCLPMMLEAFVLNFLDDLDAKVNFMIRLGGQMKDPDYQWTDFQRTLDRFLFVRGGIQYKTENDTAIAAPGKSLSEQAEISRQQKLF